MLFYQAAFNEITYPQALAKNKIPKEYHKAQPESEIFLDLRRLKYAN